MNATTPLSAASRASITSQAMLVNLTIRQWSARALDRVVTEDVARQHDVGTDAGRYNKQLVSKKHLEPVQKAVTALRQYHYENTLPWMDDGARILPRANYFAYRQEMAKLKDAFDLAVQSVSADWSAAKEEARNRLKALYREADYPTDVAASYGVRLGFLPFPDAEDFRVDLSDVATRQVKESMERDINEAAKTAMNDCFRRIGDVVGKMSERLGAYRVNPTTNKVEGTFKDSLVENIRDLVDVLPRLNFTNDPVLEQLTATMKAKLCENDADVLRTHESTRKATLAEADAIIAQLSSYLGQ